MKKLLTFALYFFIIYNIAFFNNISPIASANVLTCATGGTCAVGDTGPGGGKIFITPSTAGNTTGEYFEAACAGWSDGTCVASDMNVDPTAVWGCESTPVPGGPNDYWSTRDRTAIGDGEQNTTDIVNGCPESGIAAKVADALVLGGKDDWFLPSKDELNALCKWAFEDIVNAVCAGGRTYVPTRNGGFNAGPFWSSSEAEVWSAWAQNFVDGIQYDDYGKMNAALYVRPVRSF